MSNSIKAIALVIAIGAQTAHAASDETIYTWTDQTALTNYGDIPPDDELQNNAVRVLNMQQGVAQKLEFPNRALSDPNNPQANINPGSNSTGTAQPTNTTQSATPPPRIVGQSNPPVVPKSSSTEAPKANAPTMIASGQLDPVKDMAGDRKVEEQEAKLEEDAKTARRVAIDKRKQEMQTLAERVRNGAASRQEIAALMTYRQTASFAEARSAMARPKSATPRKVILTD